MSFIKDNIANAMGSNAKLAYEEGHTVFIAQFRGAFGHSPSLSRPIAGVAEMIEAVENQGWRLEQFTSVPYKDNMTVVGLFRRSNRQG